MNHQWSESFSCLFQTESDAAIKQAEMRIKHLQKQLSEQQKALTSKQKEGSKLQADLEKEREAVEKCKYDDCWYCSALALISMSFWNDVQLMCD